MKPGGSVDILKILPHHVPYWQGCECVLGCLMVELSYSTNPVKLRAIGMVCVKGCLKFVREISDNTTGNRHSHTKYVDEHKEFVLHHISKCNEKEIFEHNRK